MISSSNEGCDSFSAVFLSSTVYDVFKPSAGIGVCTECYTGYRDRGRKQTSSFGVISASSIVTCGFVDTCFIDDCVKCFPLMLMRKFPPTATSRVSSLLPYYRMYVFYGKNIAIRRQYSINIDKYATTDLIFQPHPYAKRVAYGHHLALGRCMQ